ncbi:radical SAM protein [Streptomyces sp. NPDC051740]|uniref:radical SAM protein n=1 Tax=Streptomyces sp. NPDC051740 TaxID=3365673 RepID=UPI00379E2919
MRKDDRLLAASVHPFELTDRRRDNQALNLEEYQQGAVKLRSRPLALFVELTENCNLKCPMCRFGEKYDPALNMDEQMFDRLADELFPYAHLVDVRGWGESTMLSGFGDMVLRALEHRVRVRVVTNGQINRPAVWDAMMRGQGIVTVSCDAASPALFKKLRGGGTLERLEATCRALVEARDRYQVPRDHVNFNVVSSMDNLDELADIVRLASRLDIPLVVIHPLVAPADDPSHLRQDLGRTREAYAEAAQAGRELGVVVQLGAAPDPSLALPEMVRKPACMHPWSYAYIRYNGDVGFCDHLIGNGEYTLGSLRENTFDEIWNGEAWQSLRQAHVQGEIPDAFAPCRYTYAQRYIDFEHLVHPDRAEMIVSSATHAEITRTRDPGQVPVVPFGLEPTPEVLVPTAMLSERLRQLPGSQRS